MGPKRIDGNKGYRVLDRPKILWDPHVKAQSRVPRSLDAGSHIVKVNAGSRADGILIDHRTSAKAANSGPAVKDARYSSKPVRRAGGENS